MTMITPLTDASIRDARLIPAATVAVAPAWFKRFGIRFVHDEDDLDSYEFAGLAIKGMAFGLLRYAHSPLAETTVLGPEGVAAEHLVSAVAGEFDLPLDSFRWRSPEQPAP